MHSVTTGSRTGGFCQTSSLVNNNHQFKSRNLQSSSTIHQESRFLNCKLACKIYHHCTCTNICSVVIQTNKLKLWLLGGPQIFLLGEPFCSYPYKTGVTLHELKYELLKLFFFNFFYCLLPNKER